MNTLVEVRGAVSNMATRNSLFVDTSGWAYLLDQSSDFHHDVQTVYQQAVERNRLLVTTNYVIAELIALLSSRSRISRQQIIAFVEALKAAPHVEIIHIDTNLDKSAWILLKTYTDKKWSLVDACSFVIMTGYGMTEAITSDHHFTQAGFVRLPAQ